MHSGKFIVFVALTLSGCIFGRPPDDDTTDFGTTEDTSIPDSGPADMGDRLDSGGPRDVGDDMQVPQNCGDGALQPEEKCDPAVDNAMSSAYCPRLPEDCEDGLACTEGRVEGSPTECNAVCVQIAIEACVDGDGCCPSACTTDTDSDCSEVDVCGDGSVTGEELCDPAIEEGMSGACPTRLDCAAPGVCQRLVVAGAAQNCDAECTYTDIMLCVDGDGCCPAGCSLALDEDCGAVCGNDVVEGAELCDGTCPTDCDDNNACTTDSLTGSAASCDAVCENTTVTMCVNGDGCCPSGCDSTDDDDCSASCGDGIVDANETCDGDCPTAADCDDGLACTADSLQGSPDNCSAECINAPITQCSMTSDGCCAPGCNATNDIDCDAVCGNDIREPGETCDGNCPTSCDDGDVCTTDTLDGFAVNCDASCSNTDITACVDGDGCCAPGCNATNDDDCGAVCGNGVPEAGETCDGNCPASCNDNNACTTDVTSGNASTCDRECSYSVVTECVDSDGCCPSSCNATNDSDCSASCGNGVVEGSEKCDGNCPTTCTAPCQTLSGSAANCDAECTQEVGCTTCTLGSTQNCTCGTSQTCQGGECTNASGTCDQACQPDSYCFNQLGPGYFCDEPNSACIQCYPGDTAGDCADVEYCLNGACTGATSCQQANDPDEWCNQSTNGSRRLCDVGMQACVECLSPSDCGSGQTCDNSGNCNPIAGFCDEDSDCADEEYCKFPDQQCDVPGSCSVANDGNTWCSIYGTDFYCNETLDECVECLDAAMCGEDQWCDNNGSCETAPGCKDAADPDFWCQTQGSGGVCNVQTDECEPDCIVNSDCDDTQYCDNGLCKLAPNCGLASKGNVWCSTFNASGWICHGSQCWQRCDPAGPSGACDCDDNGSACFQLSGSSYITCQPATFCGQICPLNDGQNAWCVEQGTGTACVNQQCQ